MHDHPDDLAPMVYRRSSPDRRPSRRERRAIERDVRAALSDSGCRCDPTLVADDDGRGGAHVHEPGCPLGDRLDALALVDRRPLLEVHVPKCPR